MASKYLNLSTDDTLGGNTPSDYLAVSQKAIKTYVDNNSGGGGSVDIDNNSITKNTSDELQTIGVINQNNTTIAIKTWTGTKAQYDAIATKDANTLYNITDDTDVTLPLLELLYPVGSIYIGTMATCPLATLGVGTWQLISTGLVKAGNIPVKGNGLSLGMTNGTVNAGTSIYNQYEMAYMQSSYGDAVGNTHSNSLPSTANYQTWGVTTDSTKSGLVADTSSLELSCNIWERIS